MESKWKNKNFAGALKCSIAGLCYVLKTEKNLKIQLIFAFLVSIMAKLLNFTKIEWTILIIIIGIVLSAEIINTAIEILLDLYTQEYNERVKIAKDIASSAVLLTSIIAVIIGCVLFLPKIF